MRMRVVIKNLEVMPLYRFLKVHNTNTKSLILFGLEIRLETVLRDRGIDL